MPVTVAKEALARRAVKARDIRVANPLKAKDKLAQVLVGAAKCVNMNLGCGWGAILGGGAEAKRKPSGYKACEMELAEGQRGG